MQLESGKLIREEGEGQVVPGTPEGCGFGLGFCGISFLLLTSLKASSPASLEECCATLSLQVAPCTADLDSSRDWKPGGISLTCTRQPASGRGVF